MMAEKRICNPAVPFSDATLHFNVPMSHFGAADAPANAGDTADEGSNATIRQPSADASAGRMRTLMYSSTGSVVGGAVPALLCRSLIEWTSCQQGVSLLTFGPDASLASVEKKASLV